MGWNLLITSNQKVSLNNPEYPEIYRHISWFCLKGRYNLKYVFVTPGRKSAITPKREILRNVAASKFDLRLIETPRIRRLDVTQVFGALKNI